MISVTQRRWLQAWPLYLLLLIFIAASAAAWLYWPQILLQSVVWQRNLHIEMTALLQQVASRPHQVGLTLMGFSLIYGILHALGPGHGKVVIATFLATHPTKMKTSIRLTLAAALLQGGVAIALVTIMLVALQLSSRQLHVGSYWLEKGSYLLVVGLGLWLCWRAGGRIVRLLKKPGLPFAASCRQAISTVRTAAAGISTYRIAVCWIRRSAVKLKRWWCCRWGCGRVPARL